MSESVTALCPHCGETIQIQVLGSSKEKAPNGKQAFRVFMDRFLTDCLGLEVGPAEARPAVSAAYRRFGRAGKDILAFAGGDPDIAWQGTLAVGSWLQNIGRSWTLDTVAKHFLDWKSDPVNFGQDRNAKNTRR